MKSKEQHKTDNSARW